MVEIEITLNVTGKDEENDRYLTHAITKNVRSAHLQTAAVEDMGEDACRSVIETVHVQIVEAKNKFSPNGGKPVNLYEVQYAFKFTSNDHKAGEPEIEFSEGDFYHQAVKFESLHTLIIQFVKATTDDCSSRPEHYWADDETVVGTAAMLALVYHDKKYIPDYIAFLRKNDLDHEVNQGVDINGVIKRYGWCRETAYLAAARSLSCYGHHGRDFFKDLLQTSELKTFIAKTENFELFYEGIVRDFKENHHPLYKGHYLGGPKEEYWSSIDYMVDNLNPLLKEAHKQRLRNDLETFWDEYHNGEG
ncbi:hypothetical protein [Paraflavitalea sp. CAU 1676]|uniref:hypothetical protein n=1 Tax=Paraflavitalea sp. CAU 1676 TaxID=3032598 RepID=UPI0023DAAFEA|nr:hypothetical protein [Paraflavitalea sp. CAU 1676]MDF2192085.1 hypothetical protein [Paraflavitalea sp. CAU 1676]